MKHTTKRLLSFVLALAMVLSCMTGLSVKAQAEAIDEVSVTTDGSSVVIGNGYISREFSTAGSKLSTTEINNKRANEVFAPAEGSEEFIIRVTKSGSITAPVVPALDRTGWTAVADSYHNASGASDGPGSNLLDGNLDSIWHTNYGGGTGDQAYPYEVVIDLNGSKEFCCFSYTPRQQGEDTNGNIKGYELWYTTDGSNWTKCAEGDFQYNGVAPIYVNLAETVTATQVKLVATSSKNGQSFAGGAEFNLHSELAPVATNDREFASSALELDGEPVIADTSAVINDVEKTGKMITFNFKPYEYKGVTYTISEVIVMYNGDHFMRKYMEIDVSDKTVAIDYIDLESMVVNADDAQWTIPHVGGIVQMNEFKANLGQPIYIQGMFFGCEFPETDNQIESGIGHIRYYTGKTFERLEADNQLTTDGKYVTWQTVAGAARSTDNQVIQADFFEYINSIATPSEFRIQYNSWFDNMMHISDENILETFIEVDQELNKVEVRPLDSYVVDDGWINYNHTHVLDASRSGTTLNQSGFWEFNSKFPNELYPSSELANKFGSNFGLWVGPRGGYNFYGSLADIIAASGKGSKAGGSIDVADRTYIENMTNMFCDFQNRFKVNYWKWDGFVDQAQYGAFAAADGVPGYANNHMTGGYNNMYHVTDMWEGWIDLMEVVRANAKENRIDNLWISLTCYTNPSPWFLQWANSVWMQCTHDQKDANFGLSKMDKQLTYRDAVYYDFLVNHQFQFPLGNIYNHDPIYGKEGTGMTKANVTDEDFQNYLYMQSTRGITFWELLISDSLMSDEKYEVAGEFLEWAEENSHILRNAKIFGGMPDRTFLENATSNEAYAEAYGFSCFDGNDGIISIRNPHSTQAKTVSFTFDRIIGVPEDAGTLKYYMVHDYRMPEGNSRTGEFTYGETYEFTLQPNEVRMFQISKDGDTTAPVMERAFSDGDKVITVRFNEKVIGDQFTVSGAEVESVAQSADNVTYRITLAEAPAEKGELTVTANVTDISGNACAEPISFVYTPGNLVTDSLQTNYGFSVKAEVPSSEISVASVSATTLVSQGDAYELGVNDEGKAYFTVNGATAVSDVTVTVPEDADTATIVGVKENNGMLKIYVNGTLAGAAYKAENRYFTVSGGEIVVGENAVKAAVYDIAFGYDELDAAVGAESNKIERITGTASAYDANEGAAAENAFDGDYGSYFATPAGGNVADQYLIADLGTEYTIDQVNYTQRYDATQQYNCTGNLLNYVIEVSTDNTTWTKVSEGATVAGTTEITFDPVAARYVKLTSTSSYHWQEANANTVMTVAELEVFKYVMPVYEPDDDSRDIPLSAVTVSTGDYEPDGLQYGEGPADLAVDNDPNTLWHTDWQGTSNENHWFQFELTESYKVDGLRYWPRQAGNTNGTITKYQILVSNDGENWTEVAAGDWENNRDWKIAQFDGQEVKYVRLQSVEAVSDVSYVLASASEIRITGTKVEGGTVEPPHEHEWSDWTVTKEATCTEDGEQTRSCECGETETEVIPALGHDWNEEGTCNNCGAVKPTESEKITDITGDGSSVDTSEPAHDKSVGNAFDGDYSTFWATVPGTLADCYLIADLGGTYTIDKVEYTKRHDSAAGYNCTGNLLDYIIEVSADGETWTQVAAGATVDGTTEITFEAVQAAYVRLRATQSYHWQDGTNNQPDNRNTVMTVAELAVYGIPGGTVEPPHEHEWTEWTVTTEPTCTTAGEKTRTCACGETETEVIPALGHGETEVRGAVAATCTTAGYTGDTYCTVCGEKIADGEAIAALGHTEEIIPAVDATCTETGLTEGKKCSVCGEILVAQEETAALGHDFVDGECTRCDETQEVPEKDPFEDVTKDVFCYDAVKWAVEKGITTGATATTFNPNGNCQRAQVVTFLWRAAGSPEPTSTTNPFTDVKETDFYYKAVLWAVEKGVTNGLTATTFGPFALCNRAQVVTFLWRAMGSPASSADVAFTDVQPGQFYSTAVAWAVEKSITNGISATEFGVGGTCNRAQVVTFLYRTYNK